MSEALYEFFESEDEGDQMLTDVLTAAGLEIDLENDALVFAGSEQEANIVMGLALALAAMARGPDALIPAMLEIHSLITPVLVQDMINNMCPCPKCQAKREAAARAKTVH